eukprot:TRINITY_DN2954_c0_g2_i1.p1 TRINITY_DN2954_c0_g2~~TRINITY_DN2954_c0_g2_i1.p1  ORF type:complete len:778 (+),score=180.00 TRINITY_DN2954_c0_g2_i1:347-2680(+)
MEVEFQLSIISGSAFVAQFPDAPTASIFLAFQNRDLIGSIEKPTEDLIESLWEGDVLDIGISFGDQVMNPTGINCNYGLGTRSEEVSITSFTVDSNESTNGKNINVSLNYDRSIPGNGPLHTASFSLFSDELDTCQVNTTNNTLALTWCDKDGDYGLLKYKNGMVQNYTMEVFKNSVNTAHNDSYTVFMNRTGSTYGEVMVNLKIVDVIAWHPGYEDYLKLLEPMIQIEIIHPSGKFVNGATNTSAEVHPSFKITFDDGIDESYISHQIKIEYESMLVPCASSSQRSELTKNIKTLTINVKSPQTPRKSQTPSFNCVDDYGGCLMEISCDSEEDNVEIHYSSTGVGYPLGGLVYSEPFFVNESGSFVGWCIEGDNEPSLPIRRSVSINLERSPYLEYDVDYSQLRIDYRSNLYCCEGKECVINFEDGQHPDFILFPMVHEAKQYSCVNAQRGSKTSSIVTIDIPAVVMDLEAPNCYLSGFQNRDLKCDGYDLKNGNYSVFFMDPLASFNDGNNNSNNPLDDNEGWNLQSEYAVRAGIRANYNESDPSESISISPMTDFSSAELHVEYIEPQCYDEDLYNNEYGEADYPSVEYAGYPPEVLDDIGGMDQVYIAKNPSAFLIPALAVHPIANFSYELKVEITNITIPENFPNNELKASYLQMKSHLHSNPQDAVVLSKIYNITEGTFMSQYYYFEDGYADLYYFCEKYGGPECEKLKQEYIHNNDDEDEEGGMLSRILKEIKVIIVPHTWGHMSTIVYSHFAHSFRFFVFVCVNFTCKF